MNENSNPLFGDGKDSDLTVNEDINTTEASADVTPEEEKGFELNEEAPAEAPVEANFEAPYEAPAEANFEAPFEAPAEANFEAPYEAPAEANFEAPAEAPSYEEPTASAPIPEAEPVVYENTAPPADAFNPYAPKAAPGENQTPAYTQPPLQNTQSNQVNPGYNPPLNQGYTQQPVQPQTPNNGFSPMQPPAPKDNKNGKLILLAVIGICVVVGIIAIVSSFFGKDDSGLPAVTDLSQSTTSTLGDSFSTTATTTAPSSAINTTQPFDQGINSIWVAEKVRPSVVGVLAYQQGELAGEGSGVLMKEDLTEKCTYIITCAHVINDPGCEFVVLLLDGTVYEATVVAIDERTDIGVLKVNATGLSLAEFGDSSSLKIGEPIYAIGNPGGSEYFGSITNGIVAAIDRSISATYTMTCIQHNAAINPGNSGGALVNTAGQIIGINSSKIAKTDFEGMGFAVPSAIFVPVVDALIEHGYVPNRPELGIKYASVSDYQLYNIIVSIKDLPRESIIIAEIPTGSALEGTQAQVGDLIIAVNGKEMDSADVLLDLIDTGAVGDTLTLTLCRIQERSYETSTFDITVKLVEDKGSITTTTQQATLPQQGGQFGDFGDFGDFFDDFFGW